MLNDQELLNNQELREELIKTARLLNEKGLCVGNSGNVSVRVENGLLITPSGVPYHKLRPVDIPLLRFDGTYEGDLKPSIEAPFHLAIAEARPEAGAIVHCHSLYATILACGRVAMQALHYEIIFSGDYVIKCAPFETPGTKQLSNRVVEALEGRSACFLSNHGQVVFGKDLESALALALQVEHLAHIYWGAHVFGAAYILSNEQMDGVREIAKDYGKQPNRKT